jgi:hypothetical protein
MRLLPFAAAAAIASCQLGNRIVMVLMTSGLLVKGHQE